MNIHRFNMQVLLCRVNSSEFTLEPQENWLLLILKHVNFFLNSAEINLHNECLLYCLYTLKYHDFTICTSM